MTFYYLRHGEPIYTPDSLTEKGHKQAEALAEKLGEIKFDRIFTSTSIRAMQTAEPTVRLVSDGLKEDVKALDFCNETYVSNEFSIYENGVKIGWCFDMPNDIAMLNSKDILAYGKDFCDAPEFSDTQY